jgi:hypothetical protein
MRPRRMWAWLEPSEALSGPESRADPARNNRFTSQISPTNTAEVAGQIRIRPPVS